MNDDVVSMLKADPWVQAVLARGRRSGGYEGFCRELDRAGRCAHPVRLVGVTGDSSSAGREVWKPCGNRRTSRCPACAHVHREDARHLVRAGLCGGKGVPASVATHPAVFVTLTAPSFGAVHRATTDGKPCHPGPPGASCSHGRSAVCLARHIDHDDHVGQALCAACYDHDGQVLWNAHANELWRRTTIYVRRRLAVVLGLSPGELGQRVRLSFCKVAEFQCRGAVHLHALLRLDPTTAESDDRLDANALARALIAAVRAAAVPVPGRTGGRAPPSARWGSELDVQVVGDAAAAAAAARYLAKYVSKATDASGLLDRPIRQGDIARLSDLGIGEHEQRLMGAAWRLGGRPELAKLRLRHWAHQFRFRGHVLSKSASWSTTFAALSEARVAWRQEKADAGPPRRLEPAGWGWPLPGDAVLAARRQLDWEEGRRLAFECDEEEAWHHRCRAPAAAPSPPCPEGKPPEAARQ